jgi:hypothetical protein
LPFQHSQRDDKRRNAAQIQPENHCVGEPNGCDGIENQGDRNKSDCPSRPSRAHTAQDDWDYSRTENNFEEKLGIHKGPHNPPRWNTVMETHFMIVVSIGKLASPLSNDSSLMVTYYVEVIHASVQ